MLCSNHFDNSLFTSSAKTRLNKLAIPTDAKNIMAQLKDEHPPQEAQKTQANSLNQTSLSKDYSLNEGINETKPTQRLSCICCLESDIPYINLMTCSHAWFLSNLMVPKIYPQNQVICYQCHDMLKKIKLFKLQVEQSFRLLSENIEKDNPKCRITYESLTIHKLFNIDISQTKKENPQTILETTIDSDDIIEEVKETTEKSFTTKSLQNTDRKKKNIEEALKIINNNQNSGCMNLLATSLQTLSHSLLSGIYSNFEIETKTDTEFTEIINSVLPATNKSTENVITENNEEVVQETFNSTICQKDGVVENYASGESYQPVTEKDDSMDVDASSMLTEETRKDCFLDMGPLGSNIRQVTLSRDQLMQERSKVASSPTYLRAPHRCEPCLIGFQFQENLEDHFKRKHDQEKLNSIQCDVCLQYVEEGVGYSMHTFWHYTRYECVACSQQFASYDKAATHYKKQHYKVRSGVLFKCPHCPYKTSRKSWLMGHMKAFVKCRSCGLKLRCASIKNHKTNCNESSTEARRAKINSDTKRRRAPSKIKRRNNEQRNCDKSLSCDKNVYKL